MKRPIIGISCTQVQYVTEGDQFWGTSADGIHEFYAKSVIEAGGLPMLLPITPLPALRSGRIPMDRWTFLWQAWAPAAPSPVWAAI